MPEILPAFGNFTSIFRLLGDKKGTADFLFIGWSLVPLFPGSMDPSAIKAAIPNENSLFL